MWVRLLLNLLDPNYKYVSTQYYRKLSTDYIKLKLAFLNIKYVIRNEPSDGIITIAILLTWIWLSQICLFNPPRLIS